MPSRKILCRDKKPVGFADLTVRVALAHARRTIGRSIAHTREADSWATG